MTQRVPSDHPSVTTVRATLTRSGGTDRPRVEIPAEYANEFPADEVVRLVLDDAEYRACIERPLTDDGRELRGAYDTPRLARNPDEGENRLSGWTDSAAVEFGGSVLVDVVEAGFKYGLRAPGERAVYEATESPDDSLAAIAERAEDS